MKRLKIFFYMLIATMASTAISAWAQSFTVVGIADGDTLTALSKDKREVRCRLYGIDAPEKKQAFGQTAKQSLSELVYRRTVDIEVVGRDRYGRSICRITVDGIDVNREQIAHGMAWMYRQYTNDPRYAEAEASAKEKHLGLWSDRAPTPPWKFRRSASTSKIELASESCPCGGGTRCSGPREGQYCLTRDGKRRYQAH